MSEEIKKLKEKVEELVKNQFPSALYNAMIKQHIQHGFKSECKCSYCQVKMYYSALPGWNNYDDKFLKNQLKNQLKKFEEEEDDII